MGTWKEASDGGLIPGDKYRVVMWIQAPLNDTVIGTIVNGFRLQSTLTGDFKVDKYQAFGPPLHDSQGKPLPWRMDVYLTPARRPGIDTAGMDPRALWAVIVLVVVSIGGFLLLSKKLEHFVESTVTVVGGEAKGVVKEVLNPGVLVLAVVGIFLLTRR